MVGRKISRGFRHDRSGRPYGHGCHGLRGICPLGPAYLPAYARAHARALRYSRVNLIGLDPTSLLVVNDRMDAALRGILM